MSAPSFVTALFETGPVDLFEDAPNYNLAAAVIAAPTPDPYSWPADEADAYDAAHGAPAAPPSGDPAEAKLHVMPKRTLGDHVNEVERIADLVEQLDDDSLTPELQDELSAALIVAIAGTKEKVDRTSAVLAMYEGLEAAAQSEIDRLDRRRDRFVRRRERLELYVLKTLEVSQLERIDGHTSSLIRRLNPPKVAVDDASMLTREYLRYKPAPPPEPNKDAIKKTLNAGRPVPGCRLERSARLVRE